MCRQCATLIKAIDRYIEKADEDLADALGEEGYAGSAETVEAMHALEDKVAQALVEETELFTAEASKAASLEEFAKKWKGIKSADALAGQLKDVFEESFTEFMPKFVGMYLERTDKMLKLDKISKITTGWVKDWSGQLGELMQLDSHRQIEEILATGLENGDDIATFTRAILDSGIRDEYFKARRASLTEVLRAHSVAQQEAFMQSPSVTGKLWRHTGTYRNEPRQNHVDMDGTVVGKAEPFTLIGINGDTFYPMYPRDPILPPEESINCHCVDEPIVNEEILGLPLEERKRLQQEAIEEMDDAWEAELDAKNKAKAGIE